MSTKANGPEKSPELLELEELRKFKAETQTQQLRDAGIPEEYENYKVLDEEKHLIILLVRLKSNRVDVTNPTIRQCYEPRIYNRTILPNFGILGYEVLKVLNLPKKEMTPEQYAKKVAAANAAKKAKAKK